MKRSSWDWIIKVLDYLDDFPNTAVQIDTIQGISQNHVSMTLHFTWLGETSFKRTYQKTIKQPTERTMIERRRRR